MTSFSQAARKYKRPVVSARVVRQRVRLRRARVVVPEDLPELDPFVSVFWACSECCLPPCLCLCGRREER
jgi:hypothetical protein